MNPELIILRIIHIVGGIMWVGTSMFMTFFLMPAIASVGPVGGQVIRAVYDRKAFTIIPIVATLVILAGARLTQIASGGFSPSWFATGPGETYAVGAIAALLGYGLFMGISYPALMRLLKLGPTIAQAPDAEKPRLGIEMNTLRARAAKASAASTILLIVAAVAMAIARYL